MADAEATFAFRAEDNTQAAFRSIQRSMNEVSKELLRFASARQIFSFFQSLVQAGDEMQKTAQKLGLAVDVLGEYQYAARLAGVENDQLRSGLVKLSKSMEEALTTRGSEAARVFATLGISLRDAQGRARSTAEVFEEIGDVFSQAADGPAKVALAIKLFGKSGAEMIPLLNSLAAARAEARAAGAVIGPEFAKNAEILNDSVERAVMQFRAFVAGSLEMQYVMDAFLFVVKSVASFGLAAWDIIRNIGIAIGSLGAASVQFVKGNWAEAKAILEMSGKDMEENTRKTNEQINKIWDAGQKKMVITITKGNKDLQAALDNMPMATDKFEKMVQDMSRKTMEANAALITDEQEKANYRISIAVAEAAAKIAAEEMSVEQRKILYDELAKYAEAVSAKENKAAQGVFLDQMDAWENTTKQMQRATARWLDDASDRLADFVMTGKLDFNSFANSIIKDLIKIRIQKDLAGIFGSAKPSGAGGGGGGDLFGSIGKMLGFAHGGAFTVGGSGGTDSQTVAFRATPGERVTVNGPGQQSQGGAMSVQVSLTINAGVSQTVRAEVMNMMPQITEVIKGAVLDGRLRGGKFAAGFGG